MFENCDLNHSLYLIDFKLAVIIFTVDRIRIKLAT